MRPAERRGRSLTTLLALVAALLLTTSLAPIGAVARDAGGSRSVQPDVAPLERPPTGWRDDARRPVVEEPRRAVQVATTDRTNIVVLMVDDLPDVEVLWSRLPTIKSMFIDHGLRFSESYGETPLCCPGRANFLTGLHTHHHGVIDNDARLLDPSMTVATQLRSAGYYTLIAGKYMNLTNLLANKRIPGWTKSVISSGSYYDYSYWLNGIKGFNDNDDNDYSTDVFANRALTFLRAAPPDQPVFALLTPYAVHAGRDQNRVNDQLLPVPAPRHVGDARCAGIGSRATPAYNEADVSDKPAYIQTRPLVKIGVGTGWPLQRLCESLLSVDEMLLRVRDELKVQGRLGNTLFVLTADNGMAFGDHRWPKKSAPYATPVPLYVRWARVIGSTPGVVTEPVSNIDIAPTLCEVGGCTLGPYADGRAVPDGRSFLHLLSPRGGSMRRDALLESHPLAWQNAMPGWFAVRTTHRSRLGRWHYVEFEDGTRELYDLQADPFELENAAGKPDLAAVEAALSTRLARLMAENPVPSPTPRPTPSPTAAPTASPTPSPTAAPTASPTPSPTAAPTASPTPVGGDGSSMP